jgi:hypothetical protein
MDHLPAKVFDDLSETRSRLNSRTTPISGHPNQRVTLPQ